MSATTRLMAVSERNFAQNPHEVRTNLACFTGGQWGSEQNWVDPYHIYERLKSLGPKGQEIFHSRCPVQANFGLPLVGRS